MITDIFYLISMGSIHCSPVRYILDFSDLIYKWFYYADDYYNCIVVFFGGEYCEQMQNNVFRTSSVYDKYDISTDRMRKY